MSVANINSLYLIFIPVMWQDFLFLLFPRVCVLCGSGLTKSEIHLCIKCDLLLPRFGSQEEVDACIKNLIGSHQYTRLFAYIKYFKKGIGQNLLYHIKYGNRPDLALYMGQSLGKRIVPAKKDFDLIIPVPLHWRKLRKRGYNQSEYLAKGISKMTGIPWSSDEIWRIRNNPSQTDRSRMERLENVRGIFKINNPARLRSKRILLVDDVITTGATIHTCTTIFMESGVHVGGIASIALAK